MRWSRACSPPRPGAAELVERLEAELPGPEGEILLEGMPISIYGGG